MLSTRKCTSCPVVCEIGWLSIDAVLGRTARLKNVSAHHSLTQPCGPKLRQLKIRPYTSDWRAEGETMPKWITTHNSGNEYCI